MHLSIKPIISLRNNNGRRQDNKNGSKHGEMLIGTKAYGVGCANGSRQDSPFRGTTCKFKVQGALPLLNTRLVHRRTFTQCEGLTLAHHLQ